MELHDFKGGKRPSFMSYFISALFGAIIGGFLLLTFAPAALLTKFTEPMVNDPTPNPMAQVSNVGENQELTDTFSITSASGKVIPSVVGITAIKFEDGTSAKKRRVQGVGTGVIVDSDGYILTNNHVAGVGTINIVVSLYDGTEVDGETVWADPVLDLAVVKIEGSGYQAAMLGDSHTVKIGESAIAIGNPLGLKFQRSVTAGVISAVNRTIQMSQNVFMEDLIQTDASINPGNSGGPLINIKGEVIAVNTVKVATAEGMGFAVPINIVKPIINSIKESGVFVTPVLGIKGFDSAIAGFFNYKIDGGIYAYNVSSSSPAGKAGLKEGDVILAIDGKNVDTLNDLKEIIYWAGAGSTIRIKIKSPLNEIREVPITLAAQR